MVIQSQKGRKLRKEQIREYVWLFNTMARTKQTPRNMARTKQTPVMQRQDSVLPAEATPSPVAVMQCQDSVLPAEATPSPVAVMQCQDSVLPAEATPSPVDVMQRQDSVLPAGATLSPVAVMQRQDSVQGDSNKRQRTSSTVSWPMTSTGVAGETSVAPDLN